MTRLALCISATVLLLAWSGETQAQPTVASTICQQVQAESDGAVKAKAKFRARGFFRPAGAFGFGRLGFLGFGQRAFFGGGYAAPFQSLRFQSFGYAPPLQSFQTFSLAAPVDPCSTGGVLPPVGGLRFSTQFRGGY